MIQGVGINCQAMNMLENFTLSNIHSYAFPLALMQNRVESTVLLAVSETSNVDNFT
jgi:hypothetical protein